jgi:hypothetical protein
VAARLSGGFGRPEKMGGFSLVFVFSVLHTKSPE